MTTTDQPTTDQHAVDYGRPSTHLAALAAAIADITANNQTQHETIERLTGERDRARDLAARLEAEIAQLQALRCGCCGAARTVRVKDGE